MIIKQVKEYGKKDTRQRIDINKGDNLEAGTKVVLIPLDDYNKADAELSDLKNIILNTKMELDQLRSENTFLKQQMEKQELNLKEIVQDVTAPIHQHYKNELENKDNQIKQLQDKLDTLEYRCTQYNLELTGYNGLELIVLRKHKNLAKQFSADVQLIVRNNQEIVGVDAEALPGNETT